uniref:Uncharacterized protein n=1 Tax=Florenciella parvula TaxID=236787 RepID=A0A7S2BX76_9STRA|mmetsp:Transcript_21657/g.45231  ORF Transcript_21657/g.45231 Transcript_21657/m.45231 type:complete len:110 (+) Transcript_21657:2-331(+)
MTEKDWPYFHLWSWNMYVVDPSGDAIQWDASYDSDMPEWYVYAADDALQNLCTQGNCTGYTATDECTAKLTELCSEDEFLGCMDCVHWKWDELTAAGCYNTDTVQFCGE